MTSGIRIHFTPQGIAEAMAMYETHSSTEVAAHFGVSTKKILQVLRDAGVTIRQKYVHIVRPPDYDPGYCKLGPCEHKANGGQKQHLFCLHCPDSDRLPDSCDARCNPGTNVNGCKLVADCPCFMPATPKRLAAYEKWLARHKHKAKVWKERDYPIKRRRANSAARQRERAARRMA